MAKKPSRSKRKSAPDKKAEKTPEKKEDKVDKQPVKDLPSFLTLLKETIWFIRLHWKRLLGVVVVYGIFYMLFVRGGSNFNIGETSDIIAEELGDNKILNNTVLTGVLISSGTSTSSATGSIYVLILMIVASLAFIWAIRALTAKKEFRIRDAYYKGMYPLIPFAIILLVVSIQLIPFTIGGFVYSTAEINGLISSLLERVFFISVWIALGALSVYWLANSLISLYAVTLPDIYPIQALRSTKKAIKGKRWLVFSRIILLALLILIASAILILTFVSILPAIAVLIYDLVLIMAIPFAHIYMFKLYRALI